MRRDRAARPEDRGAVTWAASALDTENAFSCKIYRKAGLRAGGASHPSRTFGASLEVMITPSHLNDDSRNFHDTSSTIWPEIYRQRLFRRPVFSLVRLLVKPRPYRLAPAAGESRDAYIFPIPCSLCHLMYTPYPHDPPANVATLPAPINCTYCRSKCAVRSC